MKSFVRSIVLMLAMIPAISFAQTKAAAWHEMTAFHDYMSSTFHPAEEGNFAPLKQKSDSMLMAAKAWKASQIPDTYKPKETAETLDRLIKYLSALDKSVKAGEPDEKLFRLLSAAHDTFHKIVGECRKKD